MNHIEPAPDSEYYLVLEMRVGAQSYQQLGIWNDRREAVRMTRYRVRTTKTARMVFSKEGAWIASFGIGVDFAEIERMKAVAAEQLRAAIITSGDQPDRS